MNVAEYARHRGVSHVAVLKAIKSGRIKKEADGKINPTKADKEWEENTDPSRQRARPVSTVSPAPKSEPLGTAVPAVPKAVQPAADPVIKSVKMMPTYAENKAAHEFYKAQAARLAFEKMRKNLVDRKTVDDEIFAENRRVRDRLQNIPGRVAPIVAAITDTRQIEQVLSKEIYEALMELS
ncbi:MAG: hypothetical protein HQL80_06560 [Magnetococcales bacterium]|nr:hypothetical protein [Magnetococcales bacterium]